MLVISIQHYIINRRAQAPNARLSVKLESGLKNGPVPLRWMFGSLGERIDIDKFVFTPKVKSEHI